MTDFKPDDNLGMGLKILCFLLPIVGAILYFVWKDSSPNKSKSACTAALWGFGFGIVLNIAMVFLSGAMG